MMTDTLNTEIRAHGVRVLQACHSLVRGIKRQNKPSVHGNKLWASSWVLIDYIKRQGLKKDARVMEVGCGWGLAGIYCAKKHGALVTSVDVDPEVFPYLQLHADINRVKVTPMKRSFNGLTGAHLKDVDILIGADICFWDSMVGPLKGLVRRALRERVGLVLIADPGRTTFEDVGDYFIKKWGGRKFDWTAQRPRRIQGRILEVHPD